MGRERYHIILSFWIIIPLLVEVIQINAKGAGVAYTISLYIIGLIISIWSIRDDIKVSDFVPIISIYMFYAINFLLFPGNQIYYFESSVYILLLFFVPICSFIVRKIYNWNKFFNVFRWFSIVGIICGFYITTIAQPEQIEEYFSYMEFSYSLIPCIAGCYYSFRNDHSYKFLFLCFCILGIVEILIYGARAAVCFALLFIISLEIFRTNQKSRVRNTLIIIASLLIIWQLLPIIVNELSSFSFLSESRFLTKIINTEFFESIGRNYIYENAERRLDSMGLEISGLFGDRSYNNGLWPHNYFFEIWMQMGWIIGTIIIIYTLVLFYRAVFKSKYPVEALFFIILFFGRFIISGSYAIEGRFWILIFALYSITRSHKNYNIQYKYA